MTTPKDALREALEGFLAVFWPTAEEGHTGFVDRLGMQFYRETGIWPPFKSEPMEVARDVDRDAAQKAWSEWLGKKRDAAAAAAVAALSSPESESAPAPASSGEERDEVARLREHIVSIRAAANRVCVEPWGPMAAPLAEYLNSLIDQIEVAHVAALARESARKERP